jgi:dTDP-4-dehydrorhamnose 3,5-epimerase
MKIEPRRLAGTFEITLEPRRDDRGYFMRWYDEALFAAAGLPTRWSQGNESESQRNVVRGLHFQRAPHAETKLVRVLRGSVHDVFVDLRRGSPTYGQWDAVELSSAKANAVLVPRGFAHGFCATSDVALVSYLVDNAYAPHAEGGLAWDDPDLGISWPVSGTAIVSPRDRAWPRLRDLEPLEG